MRGVDLDLVTAVFRSHRETASLAPVLAMLSVLKPRTTETPQQLVNEVKVQPHSVDFYQAVRDSGRDVRELLTESLSRFSTLTEDFNVRSTDSFREARLSICCETTAARTPQCPLRWVAGLRIQQDTDSGRIWASWGVACCPRASTAQGRCSLFCGTRLYQVQVITVEPHGAVRIIATRCCQHCKWVNIAQVCENYRALLKRD